MCSDINGITGIFNFTIRYKDGFTYFEFIDYNNIRGFRGNLERFYDLLNNDAV
jgi:hypothetical protein